MDFAEIDKNDLVGQFYMKGVLSLSASVKKVVLAWIFPFSCERARAPPPRRAEPARQEARQRKGVEEEEEEEDER